VLSTLENLGFCKLGEGGAFVQTGRIGLGGALPVNLDGGGLSSTIRECGASSGHRGVRQLRGEADGRARSRMRRSRFATAPAAGSASSTAARP